VLIIVSVILIIVVIYFYRRNKLLKTRLTYEVSDIRNMASPVKTDEEVRDITNVLKSSKYSNLTEDQAKV